MDMIEKVARAISGAGGNDPWKWRVWTLEARAAIEAMGEPDDAMRKAVNELYQMHAMKHGTPPDAEEIYAAMMGAALTPAADNLKAPPQAD